MSLDKIFGKTEKVEERALQVVASEQSIIEELANYFVKFKRDKEINFSRDEEEKLYFCSLYGILQSFSVTPKLIRRFADLIIEREEEFFLTKTGKNSKSIRRLLKSITKRDKLKKQDESDRRFENSNRFGLMLSALMQVSYDQGCNDFEFGDVKGSLFGGYLKGKKERMLNIKAKNLDSSCSLSRAENCSLSVEELKGWGDLRSARNCLLTAETLEVGGLLEYGKNCFVTAKVLKGNWNLQYAENCCLTVETLEGSNSLLDAKNCSLTTKILKGNQNLNGTKSCYLETEILEGDWNLNRAANCTAKINKYDGEYFGTDMKNCKICSSNKDTIQKIKEQAFFGNISELIEEK